MPIYLFFYSLLEERRSKKSKYSANVDYDAEMYDEDSMQDADDATGWFSFLEDIMETSPYESYPRFAPYI